MRKANRFAFFILKTFYKNSNSQQINYEFNFTDSMTKNDGIGR